MITHHIYHAINWKIYLIFSNISKMSKVLTLESIKYIFCFSKMGKTEVEYKIHSLKSNSCGSPCWQRKKKKEQCNHLNLTSLPRLLRKIHQSINKSSLLLTLEHTLHEVPTCWAAPSQIKVHSWSRERVFIILRSNPPSSSQSDFLHNYYFRADHHEQIW